MEPLLVPSPNCSVPAAINAPPLIVLAPVSVRVPAAVLVSASVPAAPSWITPPLLAAALLIVNRALPGAPFSIMDV